MKRIYLLFCLFFAAISVCAQTAEPIRVACIGNSITYGAGLKNSFLSSYPQVLQQLLGKGYDVRNYGISARTMLWKGDYPYMSETAFRDARQFQPQIVTIMLGTNDSKSYNWIHHQDFKKDMEEMVAAFQSLPTKPKIFLCLPVPCSRYSGKSINDSTIVNGVIPLVRKVAKEMKTELVDLHTALTPYKQHFPDGVHPDDYASMIIANHLYKALTGNEAPAYNLGQPFPGQKSQWKGYDRYDFTFNGRNAIVVTPRQTAPGRPWIWRPAFFGAFATVDSALLSKGFHVAYYDLTHLYGSPHGVKLGNDFYQMMCDKFKLSSKVTLEGLSRGGLYVFNWAAKNTDKVACIYADAPVCDLLSWPGRKRETLWNDFLKEWNLKDADVDANFKGNVIHNLPAYLKANIPIIACCGDSDHTVPYVENMKVIRDAYQKMGGVVELILKHGCDHHPHSLTNPEPIVDFILRYQAGYADKQHVNLRGTLNNAFLRFTKEKEGCVAFLGGSITEMKGWRDMVKEDLQQRFPYTHFTFIDTGISSTGTTPHAYRFANDVLKKGVPDLLFVEAAVNDDTNQFTAQQQVRGMEGIVRHALTVNPYMDIVMLHFIYDPFIPILQEGAQPDVILNHERVANYYRISSINLAQEIGERMSAGEFTWKEFGGTHPLWNGHKYYAASINKLFDMETKDLSGVERTAHAIPQTPLDSYCYDKGEFIDIQRTAQLKGFKYVADWSPAPSAKKISVRDGFVHVPMLEAKTANASFVLNFTGRAVGMFCVAGPHAATLQYSVDGKPFKSLNTYTKWSSWLYIPWVYMFETELKEGSHQLVVKVLGGDKTECQIRNFVVNK